MSEQFAEPVPQPPPNGLGWKTITGTIMIAVGTALQGIPGMPSWMPIVATIIISAGIALGGYGLRQAISKNGVKP